MNITDEIKELVQTGAVAVAAVEDKLFGVAHFDRLIGRADGASQGEITLNLFREERQAQDLKWGPQRHQSPEEWAMILIEEFAEMCAETLKVMDHSADGAWDMIYAIASMENDARDWLEHHDWSGNG